FYWDCYYKWIKIANDLVAVLNPETANDVQKGYLGQALAYRAMFYLDLARLYNAKPVTDPYAVGKGYVVADNLKNLTVPIVTES
ncbi:hypothetical protein, partial [Streptomyces brasiliscabiei]|uniref:hypothetical protein n=1 Tax=Streptomyces brasiliscabiei TaxID=2736302 RepID=UPI003014626D